MCRFSAKTVSGDRYCRHHDADHKAQFYRKGCHKACGHDPQSIPDRTEGASGPVLVDIPKDITAAKTEYEFCKAEPIARVTDTIRDEDLAKALAMIKAAEKPYIFVGGGAVISGRARN